jgi:hypothetical protein
MFTWRRIGNVAFDRRNVRVLGIGLDPRTVRARQCRISCACAAALTVKSGMPSIADLGILWVML